MPLSLRPPDDVVHGQEVVGIVELLDQGELGAQPGFEFVGLQPPAEPPGGAGPGQVGQRWPIAVLPGGTGSWGYSYFSWPKVEGRSRSAISTVRAIGLGIVLEQPGHLLAGLEVALGVGLQAQTGLR